MLQPIYSASALCEEYQSYFYSQSIPVFFKDVSCLVTFFFFFYSLIIILVISLFFNLFYMWSHFAHYGSKMYLHPDFRVPMISTSLELPSVWFRSLSSEVILKTSGRDGVYRPAQCSMFKRIFIFLLGDRQVTWCYKCFPLTHEDGNWVVLTKHFFCNCRHCTTLVKNLT